MTWAALTGRRSVVVSTLGVTQTLAWGSTYYLPAVFADPISAALHLPRVWFFGVFSAALLLSGLLGPLAGRMIDRYGGRDVLAATNLVFAGGLVALAFASGRTGLVLAWTILGIGMGFGLYEAAFATVAGLYGRDARNAITGITLFAGFASTVGWPTSAIFIDTFGWRGACLAWAALHLLIGLPLNRLLVPRTPPHVPDTSHAAEAASGLPWTMIVLASVFGATWFVSTAMAAHLPRLLQAMGSTPAVAVAAASLVGPAQVAARLVEFGLLRRLSPMISARLATGLHPIGATLLAIFGPVSDTLRAAARRRQRHADHRTRNAATRAVRSDGLWPADRVPVRASADPAGWSAGVVRHRARPGRSAVRPAVIGLTHWLVVPGAVVVERGRVPHGGGGLTAGCQLAKNHWRPCFVGMTLPLLWRDLARRSDELR